MVVHDTETSGERKDHDPPHVYNLDTLPATFMRFNVVDFEAFLDQWITQMDTADDSTVAKAYGSFSEFYFERNDDPARETPFRNRLGLPPRAP